MKKLWRPAGRRIAFCEGTPQVLEGIPEAATPEEFARWRRNRRKRDSRKVLLTRLHEQGSRCHFCGVEIVAVRSLPKKVRETLSRHSVTVNGEKKCIATLDHLGRIGNRLNTVAACQHCNGNRAARGDAFDAWLAKRLASLHTQ